MNELLMKRELILLCNRPSFPSRKIQSLMFKYSLKIRPWITVLLYFKLCPVQAVYALAFLLVAKPRLFNGITKDAYTLIVYPERNRKWMSILSTVGKTETGRITESAWSAVDHLTN